MASIVAFGPLFAFPLFISVTERTGYIGRIRTLARKVAVRYIEKREALGFPLTRAPGGIAQTKPRKKARA